jgi:hypothetical protein
MLLTSGRGCSLLQPVLGGGNRCAIPDVMQGETCKTIPGVATLLFRNARCCSGCSDLDIQILDWDARGLVTQAGVTPRHSTISV